LHQLSSLDEGYIDLAGFEGLYLLRRRHLAQLDCCLWDCTLQLPDDSRQKFKGRLWQEPDDEGTRKPGLDLARLDQRGGGAFEQSTSVREQSATGRSEYDVWALAFEEAHACLLFQLLYLFAERGLREMDRPGRATEVQFFGDRDKAFEMTQLHRSMICRVIAYVSREPTPSSDPFATGVRYSFVMTTAHYKNVVIGSGEGGKYLAWHLAPLGEQTVVIERRYIGGSCPNTNCLPAKNEIWSAKVAELTQHAANFGVKTGEVSVDMNGVRERKRRMVSDLIEIHVKKFKGSGAELLMGTAKFTAPMTLEIALNDGGTQTITADRIFLNLGTVATIPPVPGLREAAPMTHIEILEMARLPEHLIVIGGGYVGLEFAQAYRRFGSRVTVLQRGPRLLGDADDDVTAELQRLLEAEGIEVRTGVEITRVEGKSGEKVSVTLRDAAGETTIEGTDILVAAGRTPNTSGIGLDLAGVELTANGYIKVNDRMETTAASVWAIGECAGSPQFTHASFDDFRVIFENLTGGERSTAGRLMPSCLFTDPQVSHIGLTEREAQQKGIAVHVVRHPMAAVLRTRTISETAGFMKVLLDPTTGRILGFTMIGTEAGEIMAVVQMAMEMGADYRVFQKAVIAHPTMAEGLTFLFHGLKLPKQ